MNTSETNKLIAIFMGGSYTPDMVKFYNENYFIKIPLHGIHTFDTLRYHISWDWLIPVLERIEKTQLGNKTFKTLIGFDTTCVIVIRENGLVQTKFDSSKPYTNRIVDGYNVSGTDVPLTKIEGVYDVVIQFINWYNNQSTQ